MVVPDVNVLLYAFREELPEYEQARRWLEEALQSTEPIGLADVVTSGFLRIATHPRIYVPPTPIDAALDFIESLLDQDNCIRLEPGPAHWGIFTRLCQSLQLSGVGIPDAYLAALAIESDSEFITRDRDFARFPGLRSSNPLN
jgi:toxin-antitoxin system PIN domain toxin